MQGVNKGRSANVYLGVHNFNGLPRPFLILAGKGPWGGWGERRPFLTVLRTYFREIRLAEDEYHIVRCSNRAATQVEDN